MKKEHELKEGKTVIFEGLLRARFTKEPVQTNTKLLSEKIKVFKKLVSVSALTLRNQDLNVCVIFIYDMGYVLYMNSLFRMSNYFVRVFESNECGALIIYQFLSLTTIVSTRYFIIGRELSGTPFIHTTLFAQPMISFNIAHSLLHRFLLPGRDA